MSASVDISVIMPFMHTMLFGQPDTVDNATYAKCAHNAICEQNIQRQLCTQCYIYVQSNAKYKHNANICSIFGIKCMHIWHWMAAYLALSDSKLYRHIKRDPLPLFQELLHTLQSIIVPWTAIFDQLDSVIFI